MKKLVIISLLSFACGKSHHHQDGKYVDSIIKVFDKNFQVLVESEQLNQANMYLDSLLPTIESFNSNAASSSWHRLKSTALLFLTNNDSAIYHMEKAIEIAEKIDTSRRMLLKAKQHKVQVLHTLDYNDSALKESIPIYHEIKGKDTVNFATFCFFIASIFSKLGDEQSSIKYLNEGLHNAKDDRTASIIMTALAYSLGRKSISTDSAIGMLENPLMTKANSQYLEYVRLGNLGALYLDKGRSDTALQLLLSAIDIGKAVDEYQAAAYFHVAEVYLKNRNISFAEKYLDTALSIADPITEGDLLATIYQSKSDLKRITGQFKDALQWTDSAYTVYARYDSTTEANKTKEIEAKYTTKFKDQHIQNLSLTNLANEKISQQRLSIIIAVIAGAALIIVIIILLSRRRRLALQVQEIHLQQRLLRTQMDPHFIFNSLTVLQGMLLKDDKAQTANYLNRMAKLIQISLVNARENYVRLEDEIAGLESYLAMQKIQSADQFEYMLEVYEGYQEENITIPPMLLQPFVENAVLHGIRHLKDRKGIIHISIQKQQSTLYCTIDDNGTGLQHDSANPSKPSLSTTITQERLAIISKITKSTASLTIEDKQRSGMQGTRVLLQIPFRRAL